MIIPYFTITSAISCIFAIFLIYCLSNYSFLLTFSLFITLIILYLISPLNIFFYLVIAFGGTLAEIIIMKISSKSWKYDNPFIFGVPLWLIPLWGIAGAGIVGVHKFIEINFI